VNLPMLIKLAEVRDKLGLADAALAAQDAGRRYIRSPRWNWPAAASKPLRTMGSTNTQIVNCAA